MRGRVVAFTEPGEPFQIEEYDVPEPEPGAIIVRVTMAGICGSDLHFWRGDFPNKGMAAGHEMVGQVAALGAGVSTDSLGNPLHEGDRITYPYFYPCNRCPVCLRGEFAACPNEVARQMIGTPPYFTGAYADYYYLRPGHQVFRVPDDLTDAMVTPVNCALAQVIYGLERAGLRPGDAFVTQGAGGLGLNAIAVARSMGARPVIAIDALPGRLDLARRFGADETVLLGDYESAEDRVAHVRSLTNGIGADVVADFVGMARVIPEGIAMTRNGGAYLEIGTISPPDSFDLHPSQLVRTNKRLQGVLHYNPWAIPAALDFLQRNRAQYPFDEIISHQFPLAEIDQAFEFCEWSGRDECEVVRGVLVP
jgi:threonine dehydrogenase-like Zn-dependent dehydrogenase